MVVRLGFVVAKILFLADVCKNGVRKRDKKSGLRFGRRGENLQIIGV